MSPKDKLQSLVKVLEQEKDPTITQLLTIIILREVIDQL